VSKAHEYGAVVSVQIVVQVLPPVGARSNTTEATPPPSLAVAVSVTVLVIGEPGSVRDTAGATLSTRTDDTTADAVVFPALSAATARRSYRPSATPVVAHAQL
jgi:hypothetical protein